MLCSLLVNPIAATISKRRTNGPQYAIHKPLLGKFVGKMMEIEQQLTKHKYTWGRHTIEDA